MITFDCPHCGKHLKADDDREGDETICLACGQEIQVPLAHGHANGAAELTADDLHQARQKRNPS